MRCDDGTADGQSHTGPVNLRGKKRIEDLVRLLRGQPYAGITDGDHKLLVFRSPRLDGKLARSIHILHRINAVTDEVHHDLLQLHVISHGEDAAENEAKRRSAVATNDVKAAAQFGPETNGRRISRL